MANLVEGILNQMNRCRELRIQYENIGAAGMFGKAVIDEAITRAEESIASGDVVEMLRAYKRLEDIH